MLFDFQKRSECTGTRSLVWSAKYRRKMPIDELEIVRDLDVQNPALPYRDLLSYILTVIYTGSRIFENFGILTSIYTGKKVAPQAKKWMILVLK